MIPNEAKISSDESSQTHTNEKPLHPESLSSTELPRRNEAEAIGISDEDWETDPGNPRNWPLGKKWGTVAIVSPT